MNGMDHRYLDGSGIDARSYCGFTPRRMPVPAFALSKLPPEDSGYLMPVHPTCGRGRSTTRSAGPACWSTGTTRIRTGCARAVASSSTSGAGRP